MTNRHLRRLILACPLLLIVATVTADPADDVRELELQLKESNLELNAKISALENERKLILGLLSLNVIALPLAYFRLLHKADKLAHDRLEKIIENRPGALIKLIEEQDAERRLRRETRITIVSDRLELERLLRQHGFRNLRTEELGRHDEAFEEASAIVLDLVHGLSEEEAASIIDNYHLEQVLAFGPDHMPLLKGKAAFANSYMTLFNRLLELIKFQAASACGNQVH